MSEQVRVICTDRGAHGQLDLGGLLLGDDGSLSETTVRRAAAPQLRGAVARMDDADEDLGTLPARIYVNAPRIRDEHEGRRRFRFACPVCHRDVPWTEQTALRFVSVAVENRLRVVDVSLLP